MKPKEVVLDETALQQLCEEWQKVLRLADWNVTVSVVRKSDPALGDGEGSIDPSIQRKQAVLRVLDPVDWDTNSGWLQDMEWAIVHELVHLHLWILTIEGDPAKELPEEQAINALSDALIELKRGEVFKKKKKPTTSKKKKVA